MYGAFIGDIVGSKYEFNNIKTKEFPLLSSDCDFTDDTIMTVAVAEAIMLSREEQFHGGERSFREILIETMQAFGRKYPHPTGAYGGSFAQWLHQDAPQPYGSYGNGAAMRVSPCGLAAISIEEALALARASASVSHDHPEGIRGAEAVAAAIYLAKAGRSKAEIRAYIQRHYYRLDFTLDSIRDSYRFDGSCQGSVPQAIVAFLESKSYEDAIRNVISIGGDCDTTGAITGSIAWTYYAIQSGGYSGWAMMEFDKEMLAIKESILPYLPEEFVDTATRFHKACLERAGGADRTGHCTPILSEAERQAFLTHWESPFQPPDTGSTENPRRPWLRWIRKGPRGYTLKYIMGRAQESKSRKPGSCEVRHDLSVHKWRMTVQLDQQGVWFLSVFIDENSSAVTFSLDMELANDSHYEFEAEDKIRALFYRRGDKNRYLHDILIRFVGEEGGDALLTRIRPYLTAQYHFD